MMRYKSFAAFILSHGRANNVLTYGKLRQHGYTGKIYIIIDDEDNQADEYYNRYKDEVIMFCKKDIAERYDTGDNQKERRVVFFARNACFEIAKKLNLEYFVEFDDDYKDFSLRIEKDNELKGINCLKSLDAVFDAMLDFLNESKAKTVAFSQAGDFIGGRFSTVWKNQLSRKAMNSFFCKTDNPFQFYGRINEDVNTYALQGTRGELFLTVAKIMLQQLETQQNSGGMSDVYLDSGTFVKSFYSVMYAPSCVKIGVFGNYYKRIHHNISWNNCTPKILNERYKK